MNQPSFIAVARRFIGTLGTLAVLLATTAGIAQTPAPSADKSGTKGAPAAAVAQPATKDPMMPGMGARGDMRESMTGMMKMESMKMTGDTDRDFAMIMKTHYQGVIDMAQMQLKSGRDSNVRAMATRIIEAEQKEMKEFDQWLEKRN